MITETTPDAATGRLSGRSSTGAGADSPSAATTGRLIELLAAAGAGDRAAFTAFYRATHSAVLASATRILRSHTLAEEVTQEVYLHAWMSADRYDPRVASPHSWLLMLAHRRSVDRVRAEQAAGDRERIYGMKTLCRDHDSVAEAVMQRYDEHAVNASLATLTSRQRRALTLAFYDGYTYGEAAACLKIALPTFKSRVRTALHRLRAEVDVTGN